MKRILIITTGFSGTPLFPFAQSAIWNTACRFFADEAKLTNMKTFDWTAPEEGTQDLVVLFSLDGNFAGQVRGLDRGNTPFVVVYPEGPLTDSVLGILNKSKNDFGIPYRGDLYPHLYPIFSALMEKYELKPTMTGVC